jgi:hypothetical protein
MNNKEKYLERISNLQQNVIYFKYIIYEFKEGNENKIIEDLKAIKKEIVHYEREIYFFEEVNF